MPSNSAKHVLVTVGTTRFDALTSALENTETLNAFVSLGYKSLTIQHGLGTVPSISNSNLRINCVPFVDDFAAEIQRADLVISHAGAGSCLEVLRAGKALIVVINEKLMDNHQLELADELQNRKYLMYCLCENIADALKQDRSSLKQYPAANSKVFGQYLDKCMGFRMQ